MRDIKIRAYNQILPIHLEHFFWYKEENCVLKFEKQSLLLSSIDDNHLVIAFIFLIIKNDVNRT